VLYKVYRLRKRGLKIKEVAEIRATEILARLEVNGHPNFPAQKRVTLYDPTSGQVLGILEHAQRIEKDGNGIMYRGVQTPWGKPATVQVWWCVPAEDAPETKKSPQPKPGG
jgi:hypothetical protein